LQDGPVNAPPSQGGAKKVDEIKALEVLWYSCQGADKNLGNKQNERNALLVSSSANKLGEKFREKQSSSKLRFL